MTSVAWSYGISGLIILQDDIKDSSLLQDDIKDSNKNLLVSLICWQQTFAPVVAIVTTTRNTITCLLPDYLVWPHNKGKGGKNGF